MSHHMKSRPPETVVEDAMIRIISRNGCKKVDSIYDWELAAYAYLRRSTV